MVVAAWVGDGERVRFVKWAWGRGGVGWLRFAIRAWTARGGALWQGLARFGARVWVRLEICRVAAVGGEHRGAQGKPPRRVARRAPARGDGRVGGRRDEAAHGEPLLFEPCVIRMR